MTQALTKRDAYRSHFRAFERRLPVDAPMWVRQMRRQALSRFEELGFPAARRGNEKWKYTNVGPIAEATFEYPVDLRPDEVEVAHLRPLAPWDDSWVTLVFVDGHYCEALSTAPARPNGVHLGNLAEAFITDRDVVERHLARHATFDDDGFTALNTAFLQDGAFVHVPDGHPFPPPLHLLFVTTERAQPTVSYPRALVVAGRHTKLTVVESYVSLSPAPYFTNAVVEIVLDDGAEIHHYRLLRESPEAFHVGTTRVHQGQDSTFSSVSFALGCALGRNDLHVFLDAPGSACFLKGLSLTWGSQHLDNHISIDHVKPHTTSDQYYKGVLGGKSRAVFSGKVVVRKDAQKVNARQTDKNLILSEGAEVDTQPSLEIFADDVQCTHGATAGEVAQDALFYLRSRGLDLTTATGLVIQGFASEIIDTVQLGPVRAYLERVISEALPSFQIGATS